MKIKLFSKDILSNFQELRGKQLEFVLFNREHMLATLLGVTITEFITEHGNIRITNVDYVLAET